MSLVDPGQSIGYVLRRRLSHILSERAKFDLVQHTVDGMTDELAMAIVESSPALDCEEDTLP